MDRFNGSLKNGTGQIGGAKGLNDRLTQLDLWPFSVVHSKLLIQTTRKD